MEKSLYVETLRLEQITGSAVLGICYLDPLGYKVTYFDPDPALKEAVIEYYRQRIDELVRSEFGPELTRQTYPVQED